MGGYQLCRKRNMLLSLLMKKEANLQKFLTASSPLGVINYANILLVSDVSFGEISYCYRNCKVF